MTGSAVNCVLKDGVYTVTLDRPDRMNAWNGDMESGFRAAMVEATVNSDIRVVVLTGAGKAFCAGADTEFLKALQDGTAQVAPASGDDPWPDAEPVFKGKFALAAAVPKPVIAAVNGPAVGIGYVLSLFCDIRLASEDAFFSASFARLGLIAEKGIDWALSHLVGHGVATELLLTGRKLGAQEARRVGLVSDVFPAAEFAFEVARYAGEMARTVSPRSAAVIKRQMLRGRFDDAATVLATGEREFAASLKSDDFREAMAAMKERRTPNFPPL